MLLLNLSATVPMSALAPNLFKRWPLLFLASFFHADSGLQVQRVKKGRLNRYGVQIKMQAARTGWN